MAYRLFVFRSMALTALMLALTLSLIGCATTPESAYDKGVDWLVKNQNPDGSWGGFATERPQEVYLGTQASHDGFGLACTALGTMALQEPSRENKAAWDAMLRGLEAMLTHDPVGRATGSVFYDTWAHTYMVQCLGMLYADDRLASYRDRIAPVLKREIQAMADRQSNDGGWAYYDFGHSQERPTGFLSTSFNTGAALLAFKSARDAGFDVAQSVIDDAIEALARLRFPQGAYAYSFGHRYRPDGAPNKIQGSIGRSQVCNLALYTWERDLTKDDLLRGIKDLRAWHHYILIGKGRPIPHEGWYATAGYYFMFGHYYASRVIEQLPEPQRSEHARWIAELMAKLIEDDGSWFDFPLYGYHKAYGTAFGTMTLGHALKAQGQ